MHPSYLGACEKEGRFLNEEDFEWSAKSANKLGHAAKFWRRYLKSGEGKGGAFGGWKCLLFVERQKNESFSKLLGQGGAVVETGQLPLTKAVKDKSFTFIVVEASRLSSKLIQALKKLALEPGSPPMIVGPEFIAHYLQVVEGESFSRDPQKRMMELAQKHQISLPDQGK